MVLVCPEPTRKRGSNSEMPKRRTIDEKSRRKIAGTGKLMTIMLSKFIKTCSISVCKG